MALTETTWRQRRRDALRFASDVTEPEWAMIEPLSPPSGDPILESFMQPQFDSMCLYTQEGAAAARAPFPILVVDTIRASVRSFGQPYDRPLAQRDQRRAKVEAWRSRGSGEPISGIVGRAVADALCKNSRTFGARKRQGPGAAMSNARDRGQSRDHEILFPGPALRFLAELPGGRKFRRLARLLLRVDFFHRSRAGGVRSVFTGFRGRSSGAVADCAEQSGLTRIAGNEFEAEREAG